MSPHRIQTIYYREWSSTCIVLNKADLDGIVDNECRTNKCIINRMCPWLGRALAYDAHLRSSWAYCNVQIQSASVWYMNLVNWWKRTEAMHCDGALCLQQFLVTKSIQEHFLPQDSRHFQVSIRACDAFLQWLPEASVLAVMPQLWRVWTDQGHGVIKDVVLAAF